MQLSKTRKRHQYALAQKVLDSPCSLVQAARLDMLKAYRALVEIHSRTAVGVIHEFFDGHPDAIPEILPYLDQIYLHHLGFEVHEPHDLILPGFYCWSERFSQWLDKPIRISGTLRFPSSVNFQKRVGAYTEMMQIWVEVEGRELLIEMFAIYRPRENAWLLVKQHFHFRTWSSWLRDAVNESASVRLVDLLAGDKIWHYGIHVSDIAGFENLHACLQQWVHNHNSFKLAYEKPITNPCDTSYHTKILNLSLGQEIEFLTQNLTEEQQV